MEMDHPYFLLLFVLPLVFIFFNRPQYYLNHSYIEPLSNIRIKTTNYSSYFFWIGLFFLVLASVDIFTGYIKKEKLIPVHNYVLINDASQSMTGFTNDADWSQSPQVQALISGNIYFLDLLKTKTDTKDYVGMLAFSSDTYVVSYLTNDPIFVKDKLLNMHWGPPLSSGTSVDKAIWNGILVILRKNDKNNGDILSLKETQNLNYCVLGKDRKLSIDKSLQNRLLKIKEQIIGPSLIVFTDGFFNVDGGGIEMSSIKLLMLCKQLGVRVYFLSIAPTDLLKNNGFGKAVEDTGGYMKYIAKIDDINFNAAYEEILEKDFGIQVDKDVTYKKYYSSLLGFISFCFLYIAFIFKHTINRSISVV